MARKKHSVLTQVIATCTDPQGLKIHVQEHTVKHIKTSHVELDIKLSDIVDTVENPDIIAESNTVANSIIYIKDTKGTFSEKYYNVPAKIKNEFADGIVTSAYTSDIRKGGKILWKK